jgi:hypothetical protein
MKVILCTAAALLIAGGMLEAGEVGTMHTFTAGTPAVADEVNANFDEQTVQINDNHGRISANSDAIAATGLVGWSTLAVSRPPSPTDAFCDAYIKVGDMGTYTKQIDDSVLEVQYNGRIYTAIIVDHYIIFELRVDDAPSSAGPARALIEEGEGEIGLRGIPATITGIFENLPAGSHTVSMWVRAKSSGITTCSSGALYAAPDQGAAHLVIKEFGTR